MADKSGALALRKLPPPGVGDRRDGFPGQSPASDHLVPGYVARHEPEERSQRSGIAESLGAGQLQDRMGHVAQVEASHGAARPGLTAQYGGGGRELLG